MKNDNGLNGWDLSPLPPDAPELLEDDFDSELLDEDFDDELLEDDFDKSWDKDEYLDDAGQAEWVDDELEDKKIKDEIKENLEKSRITTTDQLKEPVDDKTDKRKSKPHEKSPSNVKKIASIGIVLLFLVSGIGTGLYMFLGGDDKEDDDGGDDDEPIIDNAWKEHGQDKTDTDNDGLPDWWEEKNGLNPNDPNDATPKLIAQFKDEKAKYDLWKGDNGDDDDGEGDDDGGGDGENVDDQSQFDTTGGKDDDGNGIADNVEDDLAEMGFDLTDGSDGDTSYEISRENGTLVYAALDEGQGQDNDNGKTAYIYPDEKFRRSSDHIELLVTPSLAAILSPLFHGSFNIIELSNGTIILANYVKDGVASVAFDDIIANVGESFLSNVECKMVTTSVVYENHTYGVGIGDNKCIGFTYLGQTITFFSDVYVTGTLLPLSFFGDFNPFSFDPVEDKGCFIGEWGSIVGSVVSDVGFLFVESFHYENDTRRLVSGDVHAVITPETATDAALDLMGSDIDDELSGEIVEAVRKTDIQLIIMSDRNNTIKESNYYFIFSTRDLPEEELWGLIDLPIYESNFTILENLLDIELPEGSHKVRFAVTNVMEPSRKADFVPKSVNKLWGALESDEVAICSVSTDCMAKVIDLESVIEFLSEQSDDYSSLDQVKALTSITNPAIAFLFDYDLTEYIDNITALFTNSIAIGLFADFQPTEEKLDALNIKGVLYHTWNYLDLDSTISPLPIILVDNYSFIDPSYAEDTLSNFYKEKDTYFTGKLAVHIKSKGYAIGTSLKGIVNAVGEGTRSDSAASWPIDVGVYDITETKFSSPNISTYHMPLVTISEGELDTYLGNEFEFKGYYINLEEAGGRIGSFIEELIDDDLKKMYENYTKEGLPLFFNDLLDRLDDENSVINGFPGFVFAYEFKEIHVEKTTLQYMFETPIEFNGDDVSKHIMTEGYALGTTVGTIVKIVSSVASGGSAGAVKYPIDLCFYNLHNFTMENYLPRIYHVPVVYITTHTDPKTGVGPTYLETPVKVEGQFIDTGNLQQMFKEAVSEICSEDVTEVLFNDLADGLLSILNDTIKPLDGFIYATSIVESPITYHKPDFEIVSNEALDTIWLQTDKEDDFPIPGFDNLELDLILPKINTVVKNVGDQPGIPTVKYIITSPSGDQEDVYSAPNPIPSNSQNTIFPYANISFLEEGQFNVTAYLFQGETFKQYITETAATFNVTKVSGHIETDYPHVSTRSMETRNINITVENTGNMTVEYTLVGINLPNKLIGMELDGDAAIIENFVEQYKIILNPGDSQEIKFDLKTTFCGGYNEYFLFYDKSDEALDNLFSQLRDFMDGFELQEVFNLTGARNFIFDLLYSCIPLSHVNVSIDFSPSIFLTDTNVSLDRSWNNSYYYADTDNADAAVLTVQYSLVKYVSDAFQGWDWKLPRLNVDIHKDGIYVGTERNLSSIKEIFLNTYKEIDFNDLTYGPGNYSFNIYLSVKNESGIWVNITLPENFPGAYVVDRLHGIIEPIDLHKLPRYKQGGININVTVKNNGTMNWPSFCLKVSSNWFPQLWYYNASPLAPGQSDVITVQMTAGPLTGTGNFTFSLLPSFYPPSYLLYKRDHEINVGPLFHETFIHILRSSVKPVLPGTDVNDDEKCYVFIPIIDEDGINRSILRMYYKANGNESCEYIGLTTIFDLPTPFPEVPNGYNLYRTTERIGTFQQGEIEVYINATDNNSAHPMYTNVTRNFTVGDDDTVGPVIGSFVLSPLLPEDDDSITVTCTIADLSGVFDDNTGSNGQGIYLLWTNDNWNTQHEILMSTTGVATQYQTDNPIPSQPKGTTVKYKVHAHDNDYDNNNASDRKGGFNPIAQSIQIDDDDKLSPLFPNFPVSFISQNTNFYISADISDTSGVYDDNTGSNGQGIYLIWKKGLLGDWHEVQMSWDAVNGTYRTDNMINSGSWNLVGAVCDIYFHVYAYDNDFDHGLTSDRTQGMSLVQIVSVTL